MKQQLIDTLDLLTQPEEGIQKTAAECNAEGHYCSKCDTRGDSMTCAGCGEKCGCPMKKEASEQEASEQEEPFGMLKVAMEHDAGIALALFKSVYKDKE